jgi:two-component system NtrC family sensor kinase
VSEDFYERRDSLPPNRIAELSVVRNLAQLEKETSPGERVVILAPMPLLAKARELFPKALALGLLPKTSTQEKLLFAVRAILQEAKLQHDLEAAESVAWSGTGSGLFDDPSIEFLGGIILGIAAARDMADVEAVLLKACTRIAPVTELRLVAYPETASGKVMGLYQLAVPIQYQGELKAHIYLKFNEEPEQGLLDQISEALLNLSDAVSLAVERNSMITKAEETKTVWEASFDAVEDPVVILDERYLVVRGNRAYSRFSKIPIAKMQGTASDLAPELLKLDQEQPAEWSIEREDRHYRVFFDPIREPLGAGRFVLRFHDITEERNLTDKIIAKEQVAELGILVGSVAHEINNPIGGVLAIGQLLLQDLTPGTELYQDIDNIVHSAERCRKIIQTMLSLVRKSDEEKSAVVLAECVQSALDLVGSEAKRLQVKLKTEFRGSTLHVHANRNRLLQVFFHLVQQSLAAIAEKKSKQSFDAFLRIDLIPGFGNLELKIEDNGDPVKHEYEIQSSVAFTVAKMILDEHEAEYYFVKSEGRNTQRLIFGVPTGSA